MRDFVEDDKRHHIHMYICSALSDDYSVEKLFKY